MENLPIDMSYLREIFWELWDGESLKWGEIYYYQKIVEIELDAGELYILKSAYGKCLSWISEKHRPKKANPAVKKGRK